MPANVLFSEGVCRLLKLIFILGVVGVFLSTNAVAQGFSVYEQGTCTMGRAGATVANTCDDGSAVFFNPAGLAGTRNLTISGGVTLVATNGGFTSDATGEQTDLDMGAIPVPHAYLTYGVNDRLAAGLGMYVPYGLGTKWPLDFEGRFLGFDNSLNSIYVQPTLAYRISDRLSVGAGLTVVFGSITLNRRVDLSEQAIPGAPAGATFALIGIPRGTDFAEARLSGSGIGIGGNIGVQFEATDWLSLGVKVLTPVGLNYEGDAEFEQIMTGIQAPPGNPLGLPAGTAFDPILAANFAAGRPLSNQDISTELTMPAHVVAGVSVRATDELELLADLEWSNWASFDEIVVDFASAPALVQHENYENTLAVRLGAEYAFSDALSLRAGFLTHDAAAPDETVTPLLPEAYRNEFTVGLGWSILPEVEINAAYQFLSQKDRRGRVVDAPPGQLPTTALNTGTYNFYAHLIGATLTVRL